VGRGIRLGLLLGLFAARVAWPQVTCCEYVAEFENVGGGHCYDLVGDPDVLGCAVGYTPGVGPCNEETGRCAVSVPFCCQSESVLDGSPVCTNNLSACQDLGVVGNCSPGGRCVPLAP
jgi:hypothetical protein